MKSDHQLRQEVMDELAWDPAVDDKRIGVEVSEGIVTLAGHLSSYAEKYAAQRAVERIGGVRGIVVYGVVIASRVGESGDSSLG